AAPATAALLTAAMLVGADFDLLLVPRWLRPFQGWDELGRAVLARVPAVASAQAGVAPIVVGDDYVKAAEIEFARHGEGDAFALDDPRAARHGRALQCRLWGVDEAGLRSRAGRDALIVVETSHHSRKDLADCLDHVASLFRTVEPAGTLDVPAWHRPISFQFFVGRGVRP